MNKDFNNIDRILNSALAPKGWIDTLPLVQLFNERIYHLGISKNQALKIMNIETKSFDAFMQGGSTKIDFLTIIKLATFLELAPSVFIDKFLSQVSEENNSTIEKTKIRNHIVKHFDLEALRNSRFIETVSDFDHIERKILEFFGYSSVFQYKSNIEIPVFSKGKVSSNEKSLKFWVNMAYATFEKIYNPNEFDRQGLVKVFPSLRAYSLNVENGLLQVAKLLFKLGITVIFIPKMYKNLHIRAATFCINDKPCIAITNYKNYYSTLWFSLFHECYHVLYDWQEVIDSEGSAHVSAGMSTGTIDEDAADEFAARYLFDDEKMEIVKPFMDDRKYVAKVARGYNVHESIVYAIYAYKYSTNQNKLFAKYNDCLIDPRLAIREFVPSRYEHYEPIPDIIKTTKSLIN
jgi:HTH-type transcriptional regulator / antitoxin HigA